MEKKSQIHSINNPEFVASQIKDIIDFILTKLSYESRIKAYPNLAQKIQDLNPNELSLKKTPGGAPIGLSISLVKNILNGRDPFFIKLVMDELSKKLR